MNPMTSLTIAADRGTKEHLSTTDKNCKQMIISAVAYGEDGKPICTYHMNIDGMISYRRNNGEYNVFK